MNLDELRSVQNTERQKDSLQNLRPSFYQEVGEYIADLEAERDRIAEQADDPFSSPEVSRLTDEIETARDVVEAVYERRMGKLVKQASLAAAGLNADDEGLTAEEEDLFEDLVSSIESNKSRVLDVLEGEDSGDAASASSQAADAGDPTSADPASASSQAADAGDPTSADPAAGGAPDAGDPAEPPPAPPEEPIDGASEPSDSNLSPADAMGAESAPPPPEESATDDPSAGDRTAADPSPPGDQQAGTPTADDHQQGGATDESAADATATEATTSAAVDRVTVKITQDLGSILGVDAREYTLETDDVVTLPEENATPLVERDAAEPLE